MAIFDLSINLADETWKIHRGFNYDGEYELNENSEKYFFFF